MGTRSQGWALACILVAAGTAYAGPKEDVDKQARAAMLDYDGMDYDAAKKSLLSAIQTAKKAKLEKDPVYAKVHVYLAVASFANGDTDGAKAAFTVAVAVDPKIQIEAAYKQPELVKLLDSVRPAGGGAIDPGGGDDDCASVKGLQHTIIDTGKTNTPQAIEALVGSDVAPTKVAVMYRTEGTTEFVEGKLAKQGACKYVGAIPAAAMKGSLIHYYVAAYNGENRVIQGASKGSSGSPNIIELTVGVGVVGGGDTEDPINKGGGGGGGNPSGGAVSGGVVAGGKAPKVFLAVTGGTGFGYVTGQTEANNEVQNCCIGNSLVVVTPELGYYVSKQLSVGIAGRIGFPIGANVDPPNAKHSTIAPGAVIRVRYALSPTGEGLRLMGQLGGGVMRNTIKLEMQPGGGDTDIVAQGPLFIGAGIGFKKNLSNNLAFVADLSALGAIAVVDKIGTAKVNSGIGGDVTLGLAVGF
jgi:hypothetical protein